MKKHNLPRGTRDLVGKELEALKIIEYIIATEVEKNGYREIRTPIFEHTDVFLRSVGESSDIVNKEMYTFSDRGNRSLTLRPEGTAGVVRAYVDQKMYGKPDVPHKFYYYGPVFRYERPQAGRYRQIQQFGFEAFGVRSPYLDFEQIFMIQMILEKLGIKDYVFKVNNIGDDKAREDYRDELKNHFKPHLSELCDDCKRRYEINPLRILDCKVDVDHPAIKNAPKIADFLNDDSNAYFNMFKTLLDDYKINYEIDESLVRGLDYYCDVVYEVNVLNSSGQDYGSVGAGGRYDNLVEEFGGQKTPACGFAFGLDRLGLVLEELGFYNDFVEGNFIQIIPLDETVYDYAYDVCLFLRANDIEADINYEIKSLKASFKTLDRKNTAFAIIIGEEEKMTMSVMVKNNFTQEQEPVLISDLLTYFNEIIRGTNEEQNHDHHEHGHDCDCGHDHHGDDHDCNCGHDCKQHNKEGEK